MIADRTMPIVTFLRHGATAWNADGRMQGRRDIPLSAEGRADVAGWALPADIPQPVRWIASPLSRAVETARLLGARSPHIEPALIEMDWGAWEGASLTELRARHGSEFARNERRGLDFRPPGGESPRDVVTRVTRWLDSLAGHGRPVVAVTHNGVLRALLSIATGWDMKSKPPVKLAPAMLHQFRLAVRSAAAPGSPPRAPRIEVHACNVPLCGGLSVAGSRGDDAAYPA